MDSSRAFEAGCQCGAGTFPSDEVLVRQHLAAAATSPDSPYFGALFERHYRFVVAAVCRFSGRFELAQDLAQEVFVKALVNIATFREDARFTTWLYAIARNCCYDHAKARAARPEEVSDEALDAWTPVVENDALQTLYTREARRLVVRLMTEAQLDDREVRAFTLHYAAGLPLDAVTARLRLRNRSGAKAQIVSAKRKLRGAVARWQNRTADQASITPWRIA